MNIEIYSKDWCPYCDRAKTLLTARGLEYTEIDVTIDTEREAEMRARSQRRSVPQIFVDGDHVGGFDDLAALDAQGGLEAIAENEKRVVETLQARGEEHRGQAGLHVGRAAAIEPAVIDLCAKGRVAP